MKVNARGLNPEHIVVQGALPADTSDGHELAYAAENLLRPFGFVFEWRTDGPDSSQVRLSVDSGDQPGVMLDVERLRGAFERISGQAEQNLPKDGLGRVQEAGLERRDYGLDLSEWGLEICHALNQGISGQWGAERSLTVHLTHDVDRVHPLDPMGLVRRLVVPTRGVPNTFASKARDFLRWVSVSGQFPAIIERIMAAEHQSGARATYFCMSGPYSFRRTGSRTGNCQKSRRFAQIVTMAEHFGHRIGLHGCAYSLERKDYMRQREALSRAVGREVTWHRNHYLVWDAQQSPKLLRESGFNIDSTVGFNSFQGFRAGLAWPYELWDFDQDRPAGIMEIPMVFMDAAGTIIQPGKTWDDLYQILLQVESLGGEVAVNFHPEYFVGQPEVMDRYTSFLDWLQNRSAGLRSFEP